MYVVRRPFKCFGKCFTTGDVIKDVTVVKGFKSKLADRKIIEVTEQNYESMKVYFKQKFVVDLPAIKAATSIEKSTATPAKKTYVPELTNEVSKIGTPNVVKAAQPAKVIRSSNVHAAKTSE